MRKEDRWKIKVWIYLWFYLLRGMIKILCGKSKLINYLLILRLRCFYI